MTFLEITNFILGATRRPTSFTSVVKLCINLAVQEATKLNNFNCLTDFENYTYPATTESIDWTTVFADADSIKSIFIVGASGRPVSRVRIFSYERLMDDELPRYPDLIADPTPTTNVTLYKAYITGVKLGFFPEPQQSVTTRVVFTTKLPTLVDDADENILLTNCPELIVNLTLQKFNNYLSEDERFPITKNQIDRSIAAAQLWDNNFANANGIDWPL